MVGNLIGWREDRLVLTVLQAMAAVSAFWSVPDDCDEIYNYWEPVHLLLYGSGLQTWEYSPEYALRSYWYPGVMALLGWPFSFFLSRLAVFFVLRLALGLFFAYCARFFYVSSSSVFALGPARVFLAVSLVALPGFFASSTALLPNSLSMCLYMVSFGCAFRGLRSLAVIVGAMSVFLGVPFSGVLLLGMAVYVLRVERFLVVAIWGLIGSLVALVPQLLIDRYFYGKWVCAVFNIVFYNALSSETDSTLYGVEPFSYYVVNLLLQLNVVFPLAATLLLMPFSTGIGMHWLLVGPLAYLVLLWSMPHKEQRFLYPIYPFLALAATLQLGMPLPARFAKWRKIVIALVVVVCLALSASRLVAVNNRAGSMTIWHSIQNERNKTICLGDEWYRFPSSFWLPSDDVRIEFIKSGFGGLLPKHFAPWPNSTRIVPAGMNNKNREETDRYVPLSSCDFVLKEGKDGETKENVFASQKILSQRTSSLFRAFYIPLLSTKKTLFKEYRFVKLR